MANFLSTELTNEAANIPTLNPVHKSTKLHFKYFSYNQGASAGAANDTIEFVKLPAGDVRIFKHLSAVNCSAFGASRVLDIGFRAHVKYTDNSAVAESVDTILDGADISAIASRGGGAGTNALTVSPSILLQAKAPVTIFGTVTGGTIPASATLEGYIVYAQN